MARSKPTRTINLTYKAYTSGISDGPLYPCVVAPRYVLHKIANNNTYVGDYNVGTDILTFNYPNTEFADSQVDLSSVKACITEGTVGVGEGLVIEKLKQGTANCLVFEKAVQGDNLDPKLNGYQLAIGDIIEVADVTTEIVDIQPAVIAARVELQNSENTPVKDVTATGFVGDTEVIYMLNVTVSEGKISAKVQNIKGDEFYSLGSNSLTLEAGKDITIGSKGIKLNFTSVDALTDGSSFYLYGFPETTGDFVEVYVATTAITVTEGTTANAYSSQLKDMVFELTSDSYTLNEGSITLNSTLKTTFGNNIYTVKSGKVNIIYRELIKDNANMVMCASDEGFSSFVGEIDPENPLAFMSYCVGLTGSTGYFVVAAAGEADEDYESALDAAFKQEAVFSVIPFKQSEGVIAYAKQKLGIYNDPKMAQFKKLWIAGKLDRETIVYDKTVDTKVALLVTVTADGVVTFLNGDVIAARVKKGQLLNIPSIGKAYSIANISNVDTLTIKGFDRQAIAFPVVAYISDILNNSEYVDNISGAAASHNSAYINYVWADTPSCVGYGETDMVYLCATLAGLRCVNAPHAPLTDVEIPGWTVGNKFNLTELELDKMNNKGVWIVFKDTYNSIVTRHQLTTCQDGTIAEEDSAVSNACAIIRSLRDMLYKYRGNANVTNDMTAQLRVDLIDAFEQIKGKDYPYIIGPQLLDYTINKVEMDPDNASRIIVDVNWDVPEPLLDGNYKFNVL